MFQVVPALEPRMRARCLRCGTTLRRTATDPLSYGFATNLAALVLFAIVWTAMLMKVSTAGIVHETTLLSGPLELVRQGLWPLAVAVGFTTALAPLVKFGAILYVLSALKLNRPWPWLAGAFLLARKMAVWAMLEVMLLGVFVALTKLGDLVHMEIGPAVVALGVLTVVVVWADLALEPDAVWDELQRRGWTVRAMPARPEPPVLRAGAAAWSACRMTSSVMTRTITWGMITACAAARRCMRASPTASTRPGPSSWPAPFSTSRRTITRC